jgi:hypothetical protein
MMFGCTSVIIPRTSAIRRESTRPVEFRPRGFDEMFDDETLFYDLVIARRGGEQFLILIGPPLLNLLEPIEQAEINGRSLDSFAAAYYARDRCCDIWIRNFNHEQLYLEFSFGSYLVTPQHSNNELYEGRRVLYTLSKDNEIEWIADWVKFHIANHVAWRLNIRMYA